MKNAANTLWNIIQLKIDNYFGAEPPAPITKGKTVGKFTSTAKGLVPVYESIEEYTAKTGKRFRVTKDQKDRQLTREQAFNETHKK